MRHIFYGLFLVTCFLAVVAVVAIISGWAANR